MPSLALGRADFLAGLRYRSALVSYLAKSGVCAMMAQMAKKGVDISSLSAKPTRVLFKLTCNLCRKSLGILF